MTEAGSASPTAIAGRWRSLPLLGWAFVGIAVVDVVGRLAGVLHPWILFGDPFQVFIQVVPRALAILLPAFVLRRSPLAARTAPLILRGAVLLAVVELVTPAGLRISFETLAPQNLFVWTVLLFVSKLATTAALVAIGVGLRSLGPDPPAPKVALYATRLAGVLVIGALVQLVELLTGQAAVRLGEIERDRLLLLGWTFFLLEAFALAFIARIVIRGSGDLRRPAVARRLAVAAFGLLGVVALLDIILAIATVAWYTIGPLFVLGYGSAGGGTPDGGCINWFSFPVLGGWTPSIVISAFIGSIALGLADVSHGAERTR